MSLAGVCWLWCITLHYLVLSTLAGVCWLWCTTLHYLVLSTLAGVCWLWCTILHYLVLSIVCIKIQVHIVSNRTHVHACANVFVELLCIHCGDVILFELLCIHCSIVHLNSCNESLHSYSCSGSAYSYSFCGSVHLNSCSRSVHSLISWLIWILSVGKVGECIDWQPSLFWVELVVFLLYCSSQGTMLRLLSLKFGCDLRSSFWRSWRRWVTPFAFIRLLLGDGELLHLVFIRVLPSKLHDLHPIIKLVPQCYLVVLMWISIIIATHLFCYVHFLKIASITLQLYHVAVMTFVLK